MTDLDRANQHASKRRAERERDARRFAGYQKRTRQRRDQRRLLSLLQAGIGGGTLQRWTR